MTAIEWTEEAAEKLTAYLATQVTDHNDEHVDPRPPGKVTADLHAVHYHWLGKHEHGGIEFEDAEGRFVHVVFDAGLAVELAGQLRLWVDSITPVEAP